MSGLKMKINKKTVIFCSILAIFCLCSFLGGCAQTPESNESGSETGTDEAFSPATDTGEKSELGERYGEYRENADLAFHGNPVLDPSHFEYADVDGGVIITSYIGEANVVVIPDIIDGKSVVAIGKGAFSGGHIRAVSIPDSVTEIQKGAFLDCGGLSTLKLPTLGDGGYLGYIFGADSYEGNAIAVPTSLDMLILGIGDTEIRDNAFAGCKTLSAVILPRDVTDVGKFAFYQCYDLVYVDLGGVESIGNYAFGYCTQLFSIDCGSVTDMGLGVFNNCTSLNKITLRSVGDGKDNDYLGYVFGAESVDYNENYVPMALRTVELSEGCSKIDDMAFSRCKYICNVILPDTVTNIGVRAFYTCRSLTSISLPNSIKSVEDDAFFGCDAMTKADLGDGLESLGMQSFFGCRSLVSVTLPDTLTEIKPSTFYGCAALTSVDLGGVKIIGNDAFFGCPDIEGVDIDGIQLGSGNDALTRK